MSKYPGRLITDLADAGHSVFFDGSGDRIQTASNAALALGANDFSIEWWEFRTVVAADDTPITTGDYTVAYQTCLLGYSGRVGFISTTGSGWNVFSDPAYVDTVVAGVWNHFVYTRSGTAFRVFMNGKLSNYTTASGSVVQNNNRFNVGGNSGGAQYDFPGYISNFRVVIGSIPTQYQTSSTTVGTQIFTPPTQLFPVTNTVLLTCNSPAILDQSSNNIAITVTGNAIASTFTPFAAYNPYNPALGASTPGVWTLDEAMQARQTRQWNMYDPHFNYTTALVRSGLTDGSQNNTFQDSSSNNFAITRNGSATQGTFTPFSQTGWGVRTCDRNYLTIPASSDFDLISTDFTVEFWVNVNAFNTMAFSGSNFFGNGLSTANNGWSMGFAGSGTTVTSIEYRVFASGAQSANTFSGLALNFGVWYHVVLQRNGSGSNNLRLFVNGVQQGAAQTAVTYSSAGSTFVLGSGSYLQNLTYSGNADYYISNVRLTRSAVYSTSGFTSPTSNLSQLSGTTLLICQSNRLINNGTNTGAITPTTLNVIPVEVVAFNPFYPTTAYIPTTVSGSAYFDGTGDYLSGIDNQAALQFGTGDFTVECWVYPVAANTYSAERGFLQISTTAGGLSSTYTGGVFLAFKNNTGVYFSVNGAVTGAAVGGATALNNWAHIAITRQSGTVRGWINGQQVTTYTDSANLTANNLAIGGYFGTAYLLDGYLSNVRIVKGVAVYTGTFTPPITPLSTSGAASASAYPSTTNVNTSFAASATSVLLNFTNAAITDATAKNDLETAGNAQASTAVRNTRLVTTPPTAMYFDGNGDYLQIGPNRLFNFGAGDFTIEFWIYPTSFASVTYPMYSSTAKAKSDHLAFEVGTAGTIVAYVTASGGGAWSIMSGGNVGTLTLNTWNHVALVRNGTNFRGYVNGVQGGMTNSSTSAVAAFDGWNIGFNGASGFFTGYMDDIRVTRGVARYTATFTPPRSRLQEQ